MIDTDKYEGHTLNHPIHMDKPLHHKGEGKNITTEREMICDGGIIGWLVMDDYPSADVNAMLLADAPLLLAEVKRLREEVSSVIREMLSDSEEDPSWGATVHAYIKDLQKVIE